MDQATQEFLQKTYELLIENDPSLAIGREETVEEGFVIHMPYTFEMFSTSPMANAFVGAFNAYRTWLNEPQPEEQKRG